jgi:hypothetical protein
VRKRWSREKQAVLRPTRRRSASARGWVRRINVLIATGSIRALIKNNISTDGYTLCAGCLSLLHP